MKLSICTESVFQGLDIVEAMGKVKDAGYDTFEFWNWWSKDVDAIAREKKRLGLNLALFCTRFTSLVDPAEHDSYLEGLRDSIAVAKKLDCGLLVTQSGADTGVPREEQRAHMIDCLKQAAPILEQAGITLLLEPLNRRDHTDIYLVRSDETIQVLEAVGSPRIRCLFDIYHQQISEGDVLTSIERYLPHIAHFHCAGNPGRHELYDGELDYFNIIAAIREMGYEGCLGLEYFPRESVEKGLSHAKTLL